ncbi:hypothetical protein [Bradyrhizobium sp. 33ap4]|uniref:hypothetical protein n=1 Tax=Bradyrhizobium sp. 33ap4 TaxID=3061630 RepID=UPI00292CBCEB|nr:hypothetical protein [Bradyrhizobium sp. 33ap4]
MTLMLADHTYELSRAVAHRIAPQQLGQLMSDEELEFRHIVARGVSNERPLATANDLDAPVRVENIQRPLPGPLTAPQRAPGPHVYHAVARCIAAGEPADGDKDELMRDLACAGMAASLRVHEGVVHE